MRSWIFPALLSAGAAVSFSICIRSTQAAQNNSEPVSVRHVVHSGYTASGRFEAFLPASFLVIEDQSQFDRVFSVAPDMGEKSNRLPPGAFDTRMVIAVIKRGPYIWGYQVEDVSSRQDVLYVSYRLTLEDAGATTFSSPLVISIERQKYTAVVFIENGKTIKKLKIK